MRWAPHSLCPGHGASRRPALQDNFLGDRDCEAVLFCAK